MKRIIAFILVAMMLLPLISCAEKNTTEEKEGANQGTATEIQTEEPEPKYSIRETVSTDIIDFTLENVELTYYALATKGADGDCSRYGIPCSESEFMEETWGRGIYKANTGRVLVCLTFTVKNKDRGSLDICGGDWNPTPSIEYDGQSYKVNGFSLNDKDGSPFGFELGNGAISYDGGKTWSEQDTSNEIVYSGSKCTIRVIGIAKFDPTNLNDPFDLTVGLVNSDGEEEYYTYELK